MPGPRWAIHPDYGMSRGDGQVYYIAAEHLAHLYGLRQSDYIVVDDRQDTHSYCRSMKIAEQLNLLHLYPRYDGDYRLPLLED